MSKRHLPLSPHIGSKRYTPERKRNSVHSHHEGALSTCCLIWLVFTWHASSLRPALAAASRSSGEILGALVHQLRPLSVQVEVTGVQALAAGLELVRRSDFDPTHTLNVR